MKEAEAALQKATAEREQHTDSFLLPRPEELEDTRRRVRRATEPPSPTAPRRKRRWRKWSSAISRSVLNWRRCKTRASKAPSPCSRPPNGPNCLARQADIAAQRQTALDQPHGAG